MVADAAGLALVAVVLGVHASMAKIFRSGFDHVWEQPNEEEYNRSPKKRCKECGTKI